MSDIDGLADAIHDAFLDEDGEQSLVDGLKALARSINNLGNADAATPMGGMEALGKAMQDSADTIASAIGRLADAIENSRP
jgi:hypothetical protein